MIRTIIVDDEKRSRTNLKILLDKHCPDSIEVVGVAKDITEAGQLITALNPSLVFLDVEMPGGTGFHLLEKFKEASFEVIFITAHMDYTLRAIKVSALDYLLKPVDIKELKEAIDKVKKKLKEPQYVKNKIPFDFLISGAKQQVTGNIIAIPTAEGLEFVNTSRIIRCSADVNYTHLYLDNKTRLTVPKTLKEYEELLNVFNFIRVHQSHLVNVAHIKKYVRGEGGYLIMSDGSNVEVSRRKKSEFLDKLFS